LEANMYSLYFDKVCQAVSEHYLTLFQSFRTVRLRSSILLPETHFEYITSNIKFADFRRK